MQYPIYTINIRRIAQTTQFISGNLSFSRNLLLKKLNTSVSFSLSFSPPAPLPLFLYWKEIMYISLILYNTILYKQENRGQKSLTASLFGIVDFNFCITLVHSVALINNFKIHSVRVVKSIAMAHTSMHGILKKSFTRCGEVYFNISMDIWRRGDFVDTRRNRHGAITIRFTLHSKYTLRSAYCSQILIYSFGQF